MKIQPNANPAAKKSAAKSKAVSPAKVIKAAAVPSEVRSETPAAPNEVVLSGEARDELIRQAAYSFYEARRFDSGCELDDWLKAERHVNQFHGQSKRAPQSLGLGAMNPDR